MNDIFDYSPEWANYIAMNQDKTWYWYEKKPYASARKWFKQTGSYMKELSTNDVEILGLKDYSAVFWKDTILVRAFP